MPLKAEYAPDSLPETYIWDWKGYLVHMLKYYLVTLIIILTLTIVACSDSILAFFSFFSGFFLYSSDV